MTMTGVRPMNRVGAGDIRVGQEWLHSVCQTTHRRRYKVAAVVKDRVTLRDGDDTETVTFGALLSDWVLVAEA